MKKNFIFKLPEIVLAICILCSGAMLASSTGGFIVNFNRVGFTVQTTMQKGVNIVWKSIFGTFTAIKDIAKLQSEYDALVEQLKDYEYLQRNNVEIRRENEQLREQLGFAESLKNKNIPAQIIGRNLDSYYTGLTVNKGARSGVRKGMPVIAIQHGNVGIVGKIITVGIETSLVMPLYDMQCNISVRMQRTRDVGIVSGNGSDSVPLSLKYIRKRVQSELHYGDIVVTSGENDNYMRDIPVGTIVRWTPVDYASTLDIELEPIIDFTRLENVLIVDQLAEKSTGKSDEGAGK